MPSVASPLGWLKYKLLPELLKSTPDTMRSAFWPVVYQVDCAERFCRRKKQMEGRMDLSIVKQVAVRQFDQLGAEWFIIISKSERICRLLLSADEPAFTCFL